jgi:hypothetical protein
MLQMEEFNSSNIPQRINALLALEEQKMFSLENIKRRHQTVKTYFNKSAKFVRFKVNEKVLLWDLDHVARGRHSKFQKLWPSPSKIAFVLGVNSYILKDLEERLFSYSTNSSHLKNYVQPNLKFKCCMELLMYYSLFYCFDFALLFHFFY